MIKFLHKKEDMLPETLTESQENLPSLTDSQLQSLGLADNKEWKLNAKMIGYDGEMNIDDFIEEKTCCKIKTFAKGNHLALFYYQGEAPKVLDQFPIAFEGDVIIKQSYETENGDWQELDYFTVEKGLIKCCILPFGLTGNFILVYGKYLGDPKISSLRDKEFEKSCENISASLKEIDQKTKEQEFIKANKVKLQSGERRYRITPNNIAKK